MQALTLLSTFAYNNNPDNWTAFKRQFLLYRTASGLGNKTKQVQSSTLLLIAGPDAQRVFDTLNFAEDEDTEDVTVILQKFDEHYLPRKNLTYERHKFHTKTQFPGEKVESFITTLKRLSQSCEFGDLGDSLVRDRVIIGLLDENLRIRLLRERNPTLQYVIDACNAAEIAAEQQRQLKQQKEVDAVRYAGQTRRRGKKKETKDTRTNQNTQFQCKKCGTKHAARSCPAFGKTCNKCKKANHFSKVCRSTSTNLSELYTDMNATTDMTENTASEETHLFMDELHTDTMDETENITSASDDENLFVDELRSQDTEWIETVRLNNHPIDMKVDTGSAKNILPVAMYKQVRQRKEALQKTKVTLTSYSGHRVKPVGKGNLLCEYKDKYQTLEFEVVKGNRKPLLGLQACIMLGLVKPSDQTSSDKTSTCSTNQNKTQVNNVNLSSTSVSQELQS